MTKYTIETKRNLVALIEDNYHSIAAGANTFVKEPKNYSSTRSLHIAESVYQALFKEKQRQEENQTFLKLTMYKATMCLLWIAENLTALIICLNSLLAF